LFQDVAQRDLNDSFVLRSPWSRLSLLQIRKTRK